MPPRRELPDRLKDALAAQPVYNPNQRDAAAATDAVAAALEGYRHRTGAVPRPAAPADKHSFERGLLDELLGGSPRSAAAAPPRNEENTAPASQMAASASSDGLVAGMAKRLTLLEVKHRKAKEEIAKREGTIAELRQRNEALRAAAKLTCANIEERADECVRRAAVSRAAASTTPAGLLLQHRCCYSYARIRLLTLTHPSPSLRYTKLHDRNTALARQVEEMQVRGLPLHFY